MKIRTYGGGEEEEDVLGFNPHLLYHLRALLKTFLFLIRNISTINMPIIEH
jgi:hypothetical protein